MGRKVKKTESSRNIRPLKTAKEINAMKRALQFGTGTVTGQNRNGLRNAMIFVFGINTGLRISDIVKAKVSDIEDGEWYNLVETKTHKNRHAYIGNISQDLENYIAQMELKPSDWLFPSRKGEGHIEGKSFYKDLKRAARQCEIDPNTVGTHTLRKTFGYHYIKSATTPAGDPDPRALYKLQKMLNHSSPTTTLRYIGLEDESMEEDLKSFRLG